MLPHLIETPPGVMFVREEAFDIGGNSHDKCALGIVAIGEEGSMEEAPIMAVHTRSLPLERKQMEVEGGKLVSNIARSIGFMTCEGGVGGYKL